MRLKIWHGEKVHEKGLKQLSDYLQRQNLDKGHLVIFDFRKQQKQEYDKKIVDGKEISMVWV